LQGGATFIQLREKELEKEQFLAEAIKLKQLCKQYGIPFVINDDVSVALEVDADGVHVGQRDMEAGEVRAKLGASKILGVSVQTTKQAILAERHGADYLGVGAVFPTGTKSDADKVTYEALSDICAAVSIPVIAIGGIDENNISELGGSGICGVAVVSAIFAQEDITGATKRLRAVTKEAFIS